MSTFQKLTLPERTRSESGIDQSQSVLSKIEALSLIDGAKESDDSDSSSYLPVWDRIHVSHHPRRLIPLSTYTASHIMANLATISMSEVVNAKENNENTIDKNVDISGASGPSLNTGKNCENNSRDTATQTSAKVTNVEMISKLKTPIGYISSKKNGEKPTNLDMETPTSGMKKNEADEKNSKGGDNGTSSDPRTIEKEPAEAEWLILQDEITNVGVELDTLLHREKILYQDIDEFLIRYGKLGEQLADEALPCINDRREERAFLTAFRKERRARREREDEEVRWAWQEIKFAIIHRRQIEEEGKRAQLRLFQAYREEKRARKKLFWTELQTKKEDIQSFELNKDECVVCGCPNANHYKMCPSRHPYDPNDLYNDEAY